MNEPGVTKFGNVQHKYVFKAHEYYIKNWGVSSYMLYPQGYIEGENQMELFIVNC